MHHTDIHAQSAELLRLSLPFLGRNKLAVTPTNYALAYEYFRGGDAALTAAVDAHLTEYGALDQGQADALYERFVSGASMENCLAFGDTLHALLERLMVQIAHSGEELNSGGGELRQHMEELQSANGRETLSALVAQMIQVVERLDDSNSRLHANLEQMQQEARELRVELEKSREQATTDALTGLLNRHGLHREMSQLLADCNEIAAVMLDIDFFKKINDTYGHMVGDHVLQRIAAVIKGAAKEKNQLIVRYGGEEFLVLMPHARLNKARRFAEELLHAVEALRLVRRDTGEKLPTITLSGGIAIHHDGEGMEALLERADRALYSAKAAGRNCIVSDAVGGV